MKNLESLISEYQNIAIPDELEQTAAKTIVNFNQRRKKNRILIRCAISAAAVIIVFISTVNLSPMAASALSRVPIVKNLVQLVTFEELSYQSDKYVADIKVPQVKGLEDKGLEKFLNQEYLAENTKLYNDFLQKIGENELSPQSLALFTNYTVKTYNEDIFTIEEIKLEVAASGTISVTYTNIDLKNQIIITLPSLFKDDSYIDVISANIKTQMKQKTNRDDGIIYFVAGDKTFGGGGFDKISPNQTFYINSDSKLAIVFDEYEVAPGSMGIVEFIIPIEEIQDILVSNVYIK
ncbi:MAG: anti-sigma-V factor rsiV [Syntrophomonadaceae bacterium]|jgi:hypothetical protein|nr:anti-sigma-V factor rsiV [Syntrophomonadaceae bacterium]